MTWVPSGHSEGSTVEGMTPSEKGRVEALPHRASSKDFWR